MRQNRLIVHIGTHKTGTSALQKFLYDNNAMLNTLGYCYPDLIEEMKRKGHAFSRDSDTNETNGGVLNALIREKDNRLDTDGKGWKDLGGIIKEKLKEHHVIFSAENIWRWDTEDILSAFLRLHNNLCVVVYLRRQDRFMESYWNQCVKRFRYCSDTFEEFCKRDEILHLADYLGKLKQIEKTVGRENLMVRVYDREWLEGGDKSIASDFLNIFGMRMDTNAVRPPSRRNTRLTGSYTEIKRIMNSVLDQTVLSHMFENLFLDAARKGMPDITGEEEYFSAGRRRDFLSGYAADNEKIAERYIGREDKGLFSSSPEAERGRLEKEAVRASDMEADMIRTFTGICKRLMTEQYMLERQNNRAFIRQIERNADWIRMSGRRLAFWGAGRMCEDILKKYDVHPDFIIDSASGPDGSAKEGIPVIGPQHVTDWEDVFVIITCRQEEAVAGRLEALGLEKGRSFLMHNEFFYC